MIELGTASLVSVGLILLAKRTQRSLRWLRGATTLALIAWAAALPFILFRPLALSSFDGGPTVITGISVVVAALCNIMLARRLGWNVDRFRRLKEAAIQTPWRAFAFMVVVAPICEEYIFRGFVLHGLLGLGAIPALVLSAGIFTAAHADPASAPHLVIAGVLFGALAIGAGGLASPIAAHAIANSIGFTVLRCDAFSRHLVST